MEFKPTVHPHNRYNPLKDEWVLVSPHRCLRPWSGQTETTQDPADDESNPLKPGAVRSNGQVNPPYKSTYVFPNDFPALLERVPDPPPSSHPLFQTSQAKGTCRVMCFHPDSKKTIPTMSLKEIEAVIDECQKEYYDKHGRSMLVEYVREEIKRQERIVIENTEWVALVPYWATWPYETMLLPKNNYPQRLTDLDSKQVKDLAEIMKNLTMTYDELFNCSFPYSMGWHGAPTAPSQLSSPHWLLHGVYLPPLLRSATIKKFMVGYELLAQSQRDLTPEQAADVLRNIHV